MRVFSLIPSFKVNFYKKIDKRTLKLVNTNIVIIDPFSFVLYNNYNINVYRFLDFGKWFCKVQLLIISSFHDKPNKKDFEKLTDKSATRSLY